MNYIENEIKRLKIEEELYKLLYFEDAHEFSIKWGMNYITFSQSKRIRPLLLVESRLAFSDPDNDTYILSGALELLHTYSLVHDDLPCMDDDDLRRGLPTLHKIKNEGYAVLVGDAILTRAFEVLARYSKKEKLSDILRLFTGRAGYERLILGQFLDLEGEGKKLGMEEIDEININKTGSLFELALVCGAIDGNADKRQIESMENLGISIGRIFQIQDDILDIIGDEKMMGKKAGGDKKKRKSSIPNLIGVEESIKIIERYRNEAIGYIAEIPGNNDFFYKLIDFVINRKK